MKLVDFRFNYKKSVALDPSTKKPIVDASTGKPVEVYHPIIPMILSSQKKRSPPTEGLLDSGSDGVVIPKRIAEYLELEMKPADRPMRVADGKDIDRFTSKVTLTIGRAGGDTATQLRSR